MGLLGAESISATCSATRPTPAPGVGFMGLAAGLAVAARSRRRCASTAAGGPAARSCAAGPSEVGPLCMALCAAGPNDVARLKRLCSAAAGPPAGRPSAAGPIEVVRLKRSGPAGAARSGRGGAEERSVGLCTWYAASQPGSGAGIRSCAAPPCAARACAVAARPAGAFHAGADARAARFGGELSAGLRRAWTCTTRGFCAAGLTACSFKCAGIQGSMHYLTLQVMFHTSQQFKYAFTWTPIHTVAHVSPQTHAMGSIAVDRM